MKDSGGAEYAIVAIGANAFKERNTITEVRLPDTINALGDYAFQNCRYIARVILPADLKTMGGSAFQNNVRLTDISPLLPRRGENDGCVASARYPATCLKEAVMQNSTAKLQIFFDL